MQEFVNKASTGKKKLSYVLPDQLESSLVQDEVTL